MSYAQIQIPSSWQGIWSVLVTFGNGGCHQFPTCPQQLSQHAQVMDVVVLLKYGLRVHIKDVLNTRCTPFMESSSFSLFSDVGICWRIEKGASHLRSNLLLVRVVGMSLLAHFPLWYVVYSCVKFQFHGLLRCSGEFGWYWTGHFESASVQSSFECGNAPLRQLNPAICGVVFLIFLEQGPSNGHMIVVFVKKTWMLAEGLPSHLGNTE